MTSNVIGANLPHNLWKEIVNTATYLHNRTQNLGWKTPYEVFYSHCVNSRASCLRRQGDVESCTLQLAESHEYKPTYIG